jgi:uncharacterized protein
MEFKHPTQELPMSLSPAEIVRAILSNPRDIEHVRPLVADEFIYVSLNYKDDALKKIMPWCGTNRGVESLVKTFVDVSRFWHVDEFLIEDVIDQDSRVAVFGRFTYTSTVMRKQITSPFAILARIANGKCTYMQFMEDTFATGGSFKSGGQWTFRSDPDGGEAVI